MKVKGPSLGLARLRDFGTWVFVEGEKASRHNRDL